MNKLNLVALALPSVIFAISCTSCTRNDPNKGAVLPESVKPINEVDNVVMGYHVPPLHGWSGTVFTKAGAPVQAVTYLKTLSGTNIIVKFSLYPGTTPETMSTLTKSTDLGFKALQYIDPSANLTKRSETSYRGLPALSSEYSYRSKGKKALLKLLRVAKGNDSFLISASLKGDPIAPDALNEADSAWHTLTEKLTMP